MSVNVDFDIRIRGFGGRQQAILQQVKQLLDEESLLDEMEKTSASSDEIRFQSGFPVIISRSYEYLPELRTRFAALEKDGVEVELKVCYPDESRDWLLVDKAVLESAPKKASATNARKPVKRAPGKTKRATSKKSPPTKKRTKR